MTAMLPATNRWLCGPARRFPYDVRSREVWLRFAWAMMAGFSSSFECHQRRMWADKSSSHAPRCCESREPVLKWMRYALCAIARTTHFEVMFMWPLENGHNMNGGAHADFFEKINFTILWNKTKNEKKKKTIERDTHLHVYAAFVCLYTNLISIHRAVCFFYFVHVTHSQLDSRESMRCVSLCLRLMLVHAIVSLY